MSQRSKRQRTPIEKASSNVFTLGREDFAQISAVEGIVLTHDLRQMLERFDREGLSPAQRRLAIIRRFAPSR